jgi:hypothetical protein
MHYEYSVSISGGEDRSLDCGIVIRNYKGSSPREGYDQQAGSGESHGSLQAEGSFAIRLSRMPTSLISVNPSADKVIAHREVLT